MCSFSLTKRIRFFIMNINKICRNFDKHGKMCIRDRINTRVGEKIAIVSDKPQTTRNRIMGVVNGAGYQLVVLDTPGIQKPKNKLRCV